MQTRKLLLLTRTVRIPTFTLESLPQQTPQQRSAVVAEGENFKIVDAELVRHVDTESLRSNWL